MKSIKVRKYTIFLVIACMILSSFNFVFAAESSKSDVNGHWAESQLNKWMEEGFIQGYADGTVKPDNPVTRGELIALINRSFGFKQKTEINFSDMTPGNWAYEEAAIAVKAGYIKGKSSDIFDGGSQASRQEVAVIIGRLLSLQGDEATANTYVDASSFEAWSKAAIGVVSSKNIMQGYEDQTFRPDAQITRAELVVTLDRALKAQAMQDPTEKQVMKKTYDAGGTYGPVSGTETVSDDVVINVPGVTLQNMVINGNLLLAEGIGSGEAFLKNVTVKGTTNVRGGGDHSIHLEKGTFVEVIVDKKEGTVRLVVEGTTLIEQLITKSPVNLELGKDAKIVKLMVDALLKMLGQGTIEVGNISSEGKGSSFEKQPLKVEGADVPVTTSTSTSSGDSSSGSNPAPSLSSAKAITAFSFAKQIEPATIDSINHTVLIEVASGTSLNGLVSTFTLSTGATSKVGGTAQVSGQTVNNFSSPVTYTVIAEDNSTQDWTVTVMVAPGLSNAKAITAFSFAEQTKTATIDSMNHTVNIQVAYGTKLNGLIATFTLSTGASGTVGVTTQVNKTTANDFSSPVIYTVIAQDNSTQNWTVNVSVAAAPSSGKAITAFSFAEQTKAATIDSISRTINIQVAYGTQPNGLVATFTLPAGASATVGGTAQVSGTTPNDFSNPITYLVKAQDNSMKDWTVKVSVAPAPSNEKAITAFSLVKQTETAIINSMNHTVVIEVVYGIALNDLTATFTLSDGASAQINGTVQVSGQTVNNFSNPINTLTYTVTAEDHSMQDWTVTVMAAMPSPQEAMLASINENPGSCTFVNLMVAGVMNANENYLSAYQTQIFQDQNLKNGVLDLVELQAAIDKINAEATKVPAAAAFIPVNHFNIQVPGNNNLESGDLILLAFNVKLKAGAMTAIQAAVDNAFGMGMATVTTGNNITFNMTVNDNKNVTLPLQGALITLAANTVSNYLDSMIENTAPISFTVEDSLNPIPQLSDAGTLDKQHIVLTFKNPLSGSTINVAAFSISGIASSPAIGWVDIKSTTVTLVLTSAIVSTDHIKISYTQQNKPDDLQTAAGVKVQNFTDADVSNHIIMSPPLIEAINSAIDGSDATFLLGKLKLAGISNLNEKYASYYANFYHDVLKEAKNTNGYLTKVQIQQITDGVNGDLKPVILVYEAILEGNPSKTLTQLKAIQLVNMNDSFVEDYQDILSYALREPLSGPLSKGALQDIINNTPDILSSLSKINAAIDAGDATATVQTMKSTGFFTDLFISAANEYQAELFDIKDSQQSNLKLIQIQLIILDVNAWMK